MWAPLLLTAATACDLQAWLQSEPVDQGYHVACVRDAGLKVHVNGLVTSDVQSFRQGPHLVRELEERLGLLSELEFQAEGSAEVTRWPKQRWAAYTALGERWSAEELEIKCRGYEGVLLFFEGGTWRWPTIRLGYERQVLPGVTLRTVALRPALFDVVFEAPEVPRLLRGVVEASEQRLVRSETERREEEQVRTSDQTWLSYKGSELKKLLDFTVRLLRIPATHFEEKLQVLRYKQNQFYDAHRDYWDPSEFPYEDRFLHHASGTWSMRHATFFWYLQRPEKGGETWFPRAHGGPIPYGEWTACDDRGVKMGNDSVAILFYSLYSSGDLDTFSWHCGCPVESGTKWAANSWVWNQPLRPPYAMARAEL